MAYTNSPLVSYTCLSPNCNSPRNHAIDTITIHEVWGECDMRSLGAIFAPSSRQASSNYGCCTDGIALFVNERDRAWTSGSASNDNRAVTIEVSNSRTYPNPVSDKVYAQLIDLCEDICKRNGKTKMVWCGSLAATNARTFKSNEMRMTLHKWFQATDCPGVWLEQHMQDIANKVNAILNKDGWFKESGKWYYYENGKKKVGWLTYKGNKYYLDKNGVTLTGWIQDSNKWYYADGSGAILKGWQTIKGKKYLFKGSDHAMVTGWYKGTNKWYYFTTKGVYHASITKRFAPVAVKVTADVLNVRESYNTKATVVADVKKGKTVYITKIKKKDGYTWGLLTNYFAKKNGWIALEFTNYKKK